MMSSGMLRRVALVGTNVSEELSASVVPSSPILVTLKEGGATFFRNVGSYKSHTV
jgi:hypothetical protein